MQTAEPARILLLGGTREAVDLAAALSRDPRLAVTTSIAGRTTRPTPVAGRLRVGGFGGSAGLAAVLRAEGFAAVIDATHPYAATMSANAATACTETGIPRLRLARPSWQKREGDQWVEVANAAAAAERLPDLGRRAFLTLGRQSLAPFDALLDLWFLIRVVEPPATPLLQVPHETIVDRGPFDAAAEQALLKRHGVDVIVSKNSGSPATHGKIAAARALALPVVMISRPPEPPGPTVESVEQTLAWLSRTLG